MQCVQLAVVTSAGEQNNQTPHVHIVLCFYSGRIVFLPWQNCITTAAEQPIATSAAAQDF